MHENKNGKRWWQGNRIFTSWGTLQRTVRDFQCALHVNKLPSLFIWDCHFDYVVDDLFWNSNFRSEFWNKANGSTKDALPLRNEHITTTSTKMREKIGNKIQFQRNFMWQLLWRLLLVLSSQRQCHAFHFDRQLEPRRRREILFHVPSNEHHFARLVKWGVAVFIMRLEIVVRQAMHNAHCTQYALKLASAVFQGMNIKLVNQWQQSERYK